MSKVLVGAIYIQCEDSKSVILRLLNGDKCVGWSVVGLFHCSDEKGIMESNTKFYLFNTDNDRRPCWANININLRELRDHALVSAIGVQKFWIDKEKVSVFNLLILSKISSNLFGLSIVEEVLCTLNLDYKMDKHMLELPPKNASDLIAERIRVDSQYKDDILNISLPQDIIIKLLVCEEQLVNFVNMNNSAAKRIISLMNEYRNYLRIPLLQQKMGKISSQLHTASVIELKEVLHYLDSLGDPAFMEMQNAIIKELAGRDPSST